MVARGQKETWAVGLRRCWNAAAQANHLPDRYLAWQSISLAAPGVNNFRLEFDE
jgi:hypothetical protein